MTILVPCAPTSAVRWHDLRLTVDADREADLQALVQELGDLIGREVPNWRDGHARWELYMYAAARPEAQSALRRTIAGDPDFSLASAVVVLMLDRVDPKERDRWTSILDPSVRGFSETRSRELEILESLRSGDTLDSDTIQNWSDWLQRKVVDSVRDEHILSVLSQFARTKRIRQLAQDALGAHN